MPNGLYSDPFLKALLEEKPKLAKEFLDAIAKSEYLNNEDVYSCLEMPDWVLVKAGMQSDLRACYNPNFPLSEFDELVNNPEVVAKDFWSIFKYPNINKEHIKMLMKSEDLNVRGMALAHPFGDSGQLLSYMKEMISSDNRETYVVISICQTTELSDELFSYLFSTNAYERGGLTIGQALWKNPTLSDEQKALLVLADIQPKVESTFWGDPYRRQYISSIPYFQSLDASLGIYGGEKFQTIPVINPEVQNFFTKLGHPLSVLLPVESEKGVEVSYEGLVDLMPNGLMHRLFWTDLCEREDFAIYRRNGYRTDDLFISHPILGREFEEADIDEATGIGGVFIYYQQKWLSGEEYLVAEQAAHELQAYEGSLKVIVEETEFYEHLGQSLIALTYDYPGLPEKYGFELTESAEDWMIDAALESAEPDSFTVSAELNSYFGETLSWRKLPDSKKELMFEFLSLGYGLQHSKLRNDSIHFLGCMALHEDTPKSILEKLAKLDDPLVNEVLASRG
jgi:hypothetical protein